MRGARRAWAFLVADAAYSGAVAGVITIIASLVAGAFHELKDGSFNGWWLFLITMVVLSGLHLEIFHRWLLPGKPTRPFALGEVLPGFRGGVVVGTLHTGFGVSLGLGLIAIARGLFALPDAWELQFVTLLIAAIINEGILLKLLLHRKQSGPGS